MDAEVRKPFVIKIKMRLRQYVHFMDHPHFLCYHWNT